MSNALLVGDDLLERGEQRADQTTDSIWLEFMKPPATGCERYQSNHFEDFTEIEVALVASCGESG